MPAGAALAIGRVAISFPGGRLAGRAGPLAGDGLITGRPVGGAHGYVPGSASFMIGNLNRVDARLDRARLVARAKSFYRFRS